ncbi:hypothetical protein [Bacillus salipaludis]|uniref:Uncharacterized protein n=1 Tax=Bacillus salipaludis TaxID=2547811 RepID=A0AA90TWQ2_9BACI|nr:hypothetical protein [Bacillus salipaludis]MDQ6600822.1 hypothetical protein [Bacillus salipaludis]
MKEKKESKRHFNKFITFTLIVGLIVAFFSVLSDNLPYLRDGSTVLELVISYLAVMINSLPMWFILAMLVGYIFARNIREAAIFGAIFTICTITFYFVIGDLYTDTEVPLSFKYQTTVFVSWYGASAIGGIFGGITGLLIKKTPYVLLILLVGLLLQLVVNGIRSWGDFVGIAQNVTYCLMIISIVIYLGITKKMKKNIILERE